MISVAEAQQLVLDHVTVAPAEWVDLPTALGRRLAEDICSDIDSPPYDKSLMDGYAVRSEDLRQDVTTFELLEEITAGNVPTVRVGAGQTTRIMTGAPMPEGADCVVIIENSQSNGAQVQLHYPSPLPAGANVMSQGKSIAAGECVLKAGTTVRPIEIALLAEVGFQRVRVRRSPSIAVMSTGDELVEPATRPAPGQIRNSNSYMLAALANRCGGQPTNLGIGRDEQSALAQLVAEGLKRDVLLLSGGVSAGVLDLVPGVLQQAGVQQVFHKVHLKPGKPIWFGTGSDGQLVFGLPGNPVSSLVCFELFVKPALRARQGLPPTVTPNTGRLQGDHHQRGDRPTYYPAHFRAGSVQLVNWQGSADMRSLADANCLAYFPPGPREFGSGVEIDVYALTE